MSDNCFIVTLTPTAQDYSGTMDKTVAEINAAYEAGQEIVFKLVVSGVGSEAVYVTDVGQIDPESDYPSFNTRLVNPDNNVLIAIGTGITNDGTKAAYQTAVYTLTTSGGVLVVTDTNGTLDKTWQEIHDVDFAVVVTTVPAGKHVGICTSVTKNRDQTEFKVGTTENEYTASSADGYPTNT